MTSLVTDFIDALQSGSKRLLVVLHGLGDSMEGYRWLPAALQLPWLNYVLVNAPDPYFNGFSWYDLPGDPEPGVRRSRELLFATLDEQRAAGFPAEQTVIMGFSQGCLMTIEAGCRYPHRLAGLVGISGYPHRPQDLVRELSAVAREQRFLLTHGTQDPLIPCAASRQGIDTLRAAGLNIDWREYPKDHTIIEAELRDIRGFLETVLEPGD